MAPPVILGSIVRKDYEEIDVTVKNPDGSVRNITSDTLVFTAKFKLVDTSSVFIKSSADTTQIEKIDAPNGRARIKIAGTDTLPVTKNLTLKCTLELVDPLSRSSTDFYDLPVEWRP